MYVYIVWKEDGYVKEPETKEEWRSKYIIASVASLNFGAIKKLNPPILSS